MRGLTPAERSALKPKGEPGEWASDETLETLIRQGRARWAPDVEGSYFEPTELGLLALRVCPLLSA